MLDQKKREYASYAGIYAGYRLATGLIPFIVIVVLIVAVLGVGQCVYNSVTHTPNIVEPQVRPEFQEGVVNE